MPKEIVKTTWLVNKGTFRLIDADSGKILEPGEPVKMVYGDYLKGQPTVVICADPNDDEISDKDQATIDAANANVAQDRAEREASAEKAMAEANNALVGAVDASGAATAATAAPAADTPAA